MSVTTRPDNIVRNTRVIAGFTLVSRFLGLARDVFCAAVFGASVEWDAFVFAFRVPNMFRRLFGEGALAAAFIPAFSECLETRSEEDARLMAGRVAVALAIVLTALMLVCEGIVLAAPWALDLGLRWRLALAFTAVLLPYMVAICLTALVAGVLNSLRHFAAPAFAPVLLNVLWIASLALATRLFVHDTVAQVYVVCAGILVAGLAQVALQCLALHRLGFRWRLTLDVIHPDVRRVAVSMLPVVFGLAALQLNVLLDGFIAVGLAGPRGASLQMFGRSLQYPMEPGANSVLYYANRLMQFPLGVFGIAVATAVFPSLSSFAARRDWPSFSRSMMRGLRLVVWTGLPAGAGLIVLREPIVDLVFNHGEFRDRAAAVRTEACLFAYSLAIWAYCAQHVLSRAFYSIKRHATPARVAGAMVALNLVLNLILVWPLAEAGLALATAICATLQAVVLCTLLSRTVHVDGWKALAVTALKSLIASGLMVAGCLALLELFPEGPLPARLDVRIARTLVPVLLGAAIYVGASALLRAEELQLLVRSLLKRRNRP